MMEVRGGDDTDAAAEDDNHYKNYDDGTPGGHD